MAQSNATKTEPVSTTDNRPAMVFVENTTLGFREILFASKKTRPSMTDGRLAPIPSAKRVTTPGLNVVLEETWREVVGDDGRHGDALEVFGLVEVYPTKIAKAAAIDLASRTNARDALNRWLEIETRAEVITAIRARLARADKRRG